MRRPTSPFALRAGATVAWLVFAVGTVAAIVMNVLANKHALDVYFVPFAAYATVGWLIAVRRPREPIGWVFLGVGLFTALGGTSETMIRLALHRGWPCQGIVMFAAWTAMWYWYPLLLLSTAYTLLLFPNGLPSRRWRPLLAVLTLALLVITVAGALSPEVVYGKAHLPNPIGIQSAPKNIEDTPLLKVTAVLLGACMVAAVASLAIRFRRSRGIERAQLKYFLLGATFLVTDAVLSQWWPAFNSSNADNIFFPAALACLPLSCGLAVLRYRLYDIDRIVSRAVTYLLVTGLIAAVYIGGIALMSSLLSGGTSVGVAASTLAAAAAFRPLRQRVQRVVDRRFNRTGYDAELVVETFAQDIRHTVDDDKITSELVAAAQRAVQPQSISLWSRPTV